MQEILAQAILLAAQVFVFFLIIKPWLFRQLRIVVKLMEVIQQINFFLK